MAHGRATPRASCAKFGRDYLNAIVFREKVKMRALQTTAVLCTLATLVAATDLPESGSGVATNRVQVSRKVLDLVESWRGRYLLLVPKSGRLGSIDDLAGKHICVYTRGRGRRAVQEAPEVQVISELLRVCGIESENVQFTVITRDVLESMAGVGKMLPMGISGFAGAMLEPEGSIVFVPQAMLQSMGVAGRWRVEFVERQAMAPRTTAGTPVQRQPPSESAGSSLADTVGRRKGMRSRVARAADGTSMGDEIARISLSADTPRPVVVDLASIDWRQPGEAGKQGPELTVRCSAVEGSAWSEKLTGIGFRYVAGRSMLQGWLGCPYPGGGVRISIRDDTVSLYIANVLAAVRLMEERLGGRSEVEIWLTGEPSKRDEDGQKDRVRISNVLRIPVECRGKATGGGFMIPSLPLSGQI